MATLISCANGDFTASGTWATVDTTSLLDSESSTNNVSTTNVDSAEFTPGAITVDGIALKISSLSTVVSAVNTQVPTGTFTVTLRDATGGTDVIAVTLNASDVPLIGWFLVTFAPQLLVDATAYLVRVVRSVADSSTNRIALYTSSRLLRTTTQSAVPGAGDMLLVLGTCTGAGTGTNILVTMNNTATTIFGNSSITVPSFVVGHRGTLTLGTAGSTNYYLKLAGIFAVHGGGTVNFGTSGTPLDVTSTFVLEFNCAVAGDFGFRVFNGGTFSGYGAAKTTTWTYLTADAAAAATTLTVVSTAGWAVGDELCIASTTRTNTQCEKRTILTVDSATAVTLTAAVTHAHSGTSPTQAEVGNLTRNIKIRGMSVTLVAYVRFDSSSIAAAQYVEIYWSGTTGSTKQTLDVATQNGTFSWQYGTVHDCTSGTTHGVFITGTTSNSVILFNNNVVYNVFRSAVTVAATTSTPSITNNLFMLNTGNTEHLVNMADVGCTFQGNTMVGALTNGVNISEANSMGAWSNNVIHSCAGSGLNFAGVGSYSDTTLTSFTIWRCTANGILLTAAISSLTFLTCTLFGSVNNASVTSLTNGGVGGCTFRGCLFAGDTSFASTNGIGVGNTSGTKLRLVDCTFGVVSGIFNNHTGGDLSAAITCHFQITAWNCLFASTNEINTYATTFTLDGSFIKSSNHDQVAGAVVNFYKYGRVESDTTIFATTTPSLKLIGLSASAKISYDVCTALIASGTTAMVAIKVRKSVSGDGAAYNGNFPRLLVRRNDHVGILTDTVLATATAASAGAWEVLTGTTATATNNGRVEFFVDADGTTGWVNIDDVVLPRPVDTANVLYGVDGEVGLLGGSTERASVNM